MVEQESSSDEDLMCMACGFGDTVPDDLCNDIVILGGSINAHLELPSLGAELLLEISSVRLRDVPKAPIPLLGGPCHANGTC